MKVLRAGILCIPGFLLVNGQASDIQSCLTSKAAIEVIASTDAGTYNQAAQPYNLRLTPSPVAIAYPASPDEVASVVTCAASSGMNVSARSGGHSYAAYGLSGNVVIDLSKLKNFSVDDTGKAVSQTGLLLGELAENLWARGQRALPHGSCAHVGTGGHPLYGGFGYFSRMAGLLSDRISAAQVVLANGTIVTASNTSNADLFWALRGAGPSFGIVTSWTFDTLPAPETTVFYQITFSPKLTADQITAALSDWQQFATGAPKELAMSCTLGPAGTDGVALTLQGFYYGASTQFNTVIEGLLTKLPTSQKVNSTVVDWLDGLAAFDEHFNTSQPDIHDTFFAKSLVTTQPSTNESIGAWVKYLFGPGLKTDVSWFVQIDLYGGEITAVGADATAFAHRDAFLVYQLYASSSSSLPPYPTDGIMFVNNMLASLEPNPSAAYPNYIDPTLSTDQWQSLYFGNHIDRLEQIKGEVDPRNVFNFPQAISPASSLASSPGTSTSPQHSAASSDGFPTRLMMLLLYLLIGGFASFGRSCILYL